MIIIRNKSKLINKITREMDTYILYLCDGFYTYIYSHQVKENIWTIRYPGATVGYIEVDKNNKILDIVLYKDIPSFYNKNVENVFCKYIGSDLKWI